MSDRIDHISRDYLEEKFQGVYRRQDDMQKALDTESNKNSRDKAELFLRVGQTEGKVSAIEQTRPTIGKILAAIMAVAGVMIAIAELLIK